MANFDELLKLAHKNVEALGKKIEEFDAIHQDILSLKNTAIQENEGLKSAIMADANKIKNEVVEQIEGLIKEATEIQKGATAIPTTFQEKFEQIKTLSEQYLKGLDITTHKYLEGNNQLFDKNQLDFSRKVVEIGQKANTIQEEIDRLKKIDLVAEFERLRKDFLTKAATELSKELNKVDGKVAQFDPPLKRLEAVNLEKHFDKLQKTLGEIFGAINAINLTFTRVTQTLVSIQTSINDGFKTTREEAKKHLNQQDSQIEAVKATQNILIENLEEVKKEFKIRQESQNEILQELRQDYNNLSNKLDTLTKIQIAGFVVIILALMILKFF